MTDSGRDTAYAALVDALIALRRDPATERFDEYLDYAQTSGRIDAPTARALRWWQRQSVRGVSDHVEDILPSLLVQLEAADQAAVRAVDASEDAWRSANGQALTRTQATMSDPDARSSAVVTPPVDRPVAEVTPVDPSGAAVPANTSIDPSVESQAARVDPAVTEIPSEQIANSNVPTNPNYGENPTEPGASQSEESGASVQRTMTAGLTVVPEGFKE